MHTCVCVCMCKEIDRGRERQTEREGDSILIYMKFLSDCISVSAFYI